jgi:hypothetical protein
MDGKDLPAPCRKKKTVSAFAVRLIRLCIFASLHQTTLQILPPFLNLENPRSFKIAMESRVSQNSCQHKTIQDFDSVELEKAAKEI